MRRCISSSKSSDFRISPVISRLLSAGRIPPLWFRRSRDNRISWNSFLLRFLERSLHRFPLEEDLERRSFCRKIPRLEICQLRCACIYSHSFSILSEYNLNHVFSINFKVTSERKHREEKKKKKKNSVPI